MIGSNSSSDHSVGGIGSNGGSPSSRWKDWKINEFGKNICDT